MEVPLPVATKDLLSPESSPLTERSHNPLWNPSKAYNKNSIAIRQPKRRAPWADHPIPPQARGIGGYRIGVVYATPTGLLFVSASPSPIPFQIVNHS